MNQNTTSDKSEKSVKVISGARESELLAIFRTLHGKVLVALQEVGEKPTFEQDFGKCTNEDYKNLHQQSRVLVSAARKARWEEEVREVRAGIASVINTHMLAQRGEKADYDAIPAQHRKFLAPFPTSFTIALSALTSAFPAGTNEGDMVKRCKELSYNIVKVGESLAIRVQFVPAPTSEQKSDSDTKAA